MPSTFKSSWLARILSSLALFLMYASVREMFGSDGPIGGRRELAASTMAAALVFALLAIWLKDRSLAAGEARRTALAEAYFLDVIRDLANGEAPAFTLYLRPFKLTNQINYHNPKADLVLRDILTDEQKDIERLLAEAVESSAPLVALGRPGEHLGAARIVVSDEQWRDAVAMLSHAAERIILMPYPADGTLWEIEHVFAASLLDKVVFLMPASADHEVDVKSYWASCADIVKTRLGAELPDWRSDGALFSMTAAGQVGTAVSLPLASSKLRKEIGRLAVASSRAPSAEVAASANRLHQQFEQEIEARTAIVAEERSPSAGELLPATTRDLSHRPEAAIVVAAVAVCIAYCCRPAVLPVRASSAGRMTIESNEKQF